MTGWTAAAGTVAAAAAASALFGIWSAATPARSMALYQAIMRRCNWRVEPIDAARELRTTRLLGVGIALLSAAACVLAARLGR